MCASRPKPEDLHAVRIAAGGANLVLGCDMVVAASPAALSRIEQGVTKAVINGHVQPVAAFVMNGDMDLGAEAMMKSIRDAAGDEAATFVDGTGLATAILGDSIATNLFMLGYAWQKGLLPLSFEAIERAIELNGVAVETSKRTFAWGRLAAHNLAAVQAAAKPTLRVEKPVARTLPEIVAKRVELLTAYQDKAYAERYSAFVDKVARAEKEKAPGRRGLAEAVAKSLYKLMAYKDEYEVGAPLQRRRVPEEARHAVRGRLQAHLPPGAAAVRRSRSGDRPAQEARIRRLDACRCSACSPSLKRLRGTRLDIFGYTEERRMERRLIGEYEATVETLLASARPEQPRARRPDRGVAGDDARLRPHQGQEHRDGQGARSDPARRLPQPGAAVGRRRIAPEKGGTPALPNGVGGGSAGVPVNAPTAKGGFAAAHSRYRPLIRGNVSAIRGRKMHI